MSSENTGTSWVYKLNRAELIKESLERGIEEEGTVDEMRKRLVKFFKSPLFQEEGSDTSGTEVADNSEREVDHKAGPSANRVSKMRKHSRREEVSEAQIVDVVRKWSVRYEGGQEAMEFIERVEELAQCFQIPLDRMVFTLPELLKGKAIIWHRNNKTRWETWSEFRQCFYQFFMPRRYLKSLSDEIRNRKQKPRETARDYVNALQTLMRRQGKSADRQLERIYENLQIEYRLYIKPRDFSSVEELLELADEYEYFKNEVKLESTWRNASHSMTSSPDFNGYLPNYDKRICCFRCGKPGHGRQSCRAKGILFCSQCGKMNVRSSDCHPSENVLPGNRGAAGSPGQLTRPQTNPFRRTEQ